MGKERQKSRSSPVAASFDDSAEKTFAPFTSFEDVLTALESMPQQVIFDIANPGAVGEFLTFKERLKATISLDVWASIDADQDMSPEKKQSCAKRLLSACDLHGEAFRDYSEVLPALLALNRVCQQCQSGQITLFELGAAHYSFRLRFQALQLERGPRYQAYVNEHYQHSQYNDTILALIKGVVDDKQRFDALLLHSTTSEQGESALFRALSDLSSQSASSVTAGRHRVHSSLPLDSDDEEYSFEEYESYPSYPSSSGSHSPTGTSSGRSSSGGFRDSEEDTETEYFDPEYDDDHQIPASELGEESDIFISYYPSAWQEVMREIISRAISADDRDQKLITFFANQAPKDNDEMIKPFRVYGYDNDKRNLLKEKLKSWLQDKAFIESYPESWQETMHTVFFQAVSLGDRDQGLMEYFASQIPHENNDEVLANLILPFSLQYQYDAEKLFSLKEKLKLWQKNIIFIGYFKNNDDQRNFYSIISKASSAEERDWMLIGYMTRYFINVTKAKEIINLFKTCFGYSKEECDRLKNLLIKNKAFISLFPASKQEKLLSIISAASSEAERDQFIIEWIAQNKKKMSHHSLEAMISRFMVFYGDDDEKLRTLWQNLERWRQHYAFIQSFPKGFQKDIYAQIKASDNRDTQELAIITFVLARMSVADVWPLLERAFGAYGYQEDDFERLRDVLSRCLLDNGISANKDFREAIVVETLNQYYLYSLCEQFKEAIYIKCLSDKGIESLVSGFWLQIRFDRNLKLSFTSEYSADDLSIDTNKLIYYMEKISSFLKLHNIIISEAEAAEARESPSFKTNMQSFYSNLQRSCPIEHIWNRAETTGHYVESVKEEAEKLWQLYQQKSSVSAASNVVELPPAMAGNSTRASSAHPLPIGGPAARSIIHLSNLNIRAECERTQNELIQMYAELEAKRAVEFIYNTIMQHSWRVGLLGKVKDLFGVSYKVEEDFHMPGQSQRASKLSRHQQQMIDLLKPFFRQDTRETPASWVHILRQLQGINDDAKNQHSRLRSRQMQNFYNSTARQLAAIDSLSRANTSDVSPPASSSSPSNLGLPPISSAPAEVSSSGPLPAPSASSVDSQSPDPMSIESAASPDSVGSSSPPEGSKHRRTQSLSSVTSAPAESTPSNSLFGSSLIFSNPNASSNAPTTSATEVTSPSKSGHHRTKSG